MATTNPTVYRLTIALIVFVLLTFILTITTYLFFKQRMDEQTKAVAAEKAQSDKQQALMAAQQEVQKLREIIGAAEGVTVETIETDLNTLFTKDFAGFNEEPKSYGKLVAWLRGQFRDKDKAVQSAKTDNDTLKKETDRRIADAAARQKAAEDGKNDAEAKRQKQEQDYQTRWTGHEAEQTKLREQKEAAEKQANRLELLIAEIASGGQYLPANRQKDFTSKEAAEDKLDVIYAELRDRAKVIDEQNRILASLRVADRGLQETVLAATPKDDRIDGFDGRVLSVDERERSVLVSCESTRGIRPGMILHVFQPDEGRPQAGDRKGVVEVTAIEGPSLLRARIRRDSNRTPILAGDGVATSLWAAGTSPEVVIVGWVNLDDVGDADRGRLVDLVTRAGGRVVDAVTPMTSLVVDAGKPPAERGDEGFAEEARRQARSLATAKQYGVRVVGIDALLDMLGLSRSALASDRLPRDAASR
jgi:hypothetical protein